MNFSNEEKQACFDKISELYFCKNFGSTSKADLEVLLFSEYIGHCISAGEPYDDYTLSKQLGITQSRVRTLKERKELKYPCKGFDWRTSFSDSVKNAKYDEADHYVKILIQDVNVLNEARHFIEEKGWYDECSLNKKLLRFPLDCFVEICLDDMTLADTFSVEAKENINAIAESNSDIHAFLSDFSKEGFKTFLMNASKQAILSVISLLPFGGLAKTAFSFLETVIGGI